MYPELFRVPGIGIMLSTYGLLLAAGFIAGLWLAARLAEKDGLPRSKVYDLGLYILASGLLGSKLLMIVTEWDLYKNDWSRVLSFEVLRSGGVYYGGFLIALVVSILLIKWWRLPWRRTADAFAPGIALGHSIGRVGCFCAGCCWGVPTDSWIGVQFTERANELTGVPVHIHLVPIQLIEAGVNLLIFVALLLLRRRRVFDGQIIFSYLILYSIARFILEFWRYDERGELLGVSTSQFISVLLLPVGAALMIYYWRRRHRDGEADRVETHGTDAEYSSVSEA